MICQICTRVINTEELDPKAVTICSICLMPFHLNFITYSENENPHSGQADNI